MKFDNIAVVIRGQKRMWDYTKFNIFETYGKISKNIDWFVSVWDDTPNEHINGFKKDFEGKNLIEIIQASDHDKYYESFQNIGWLQHNAIPILKKQFKTNRYDVIFDQRTDTVVWAVPSNCRATSIETMTMYTPIPAKFLKYEIPWKPENLNVEGYLIDDRGCMTDIHTYEILSTRYMIERDHKKFPEHCLSDFCFEKGIMMPGGSWINQQIVRPEIYLKFPEIPKNFDHSFVEYCNYSIERWKNYNKEEKSEIMNKFGIAIFDYELTTSS